MFFLFVSRFLFYRQLKKPIRAERVRAHVVVGYALFRVILLA